jgi:hypothetical protein
VANAVEHHSQVGGATTIVECLISLILGTPRCRQDSAFVLAGQDGLAVREARLKHPGSHRPAPTAVCVAACRSQMARAGGSDSGKAGVLLTPKD